MKFTNLDQARAVLKSASGAGIELSVGPGGDIAATGPRGELSRLGPEITRHKSCILEFLRLAELARQTHSSALARGHNPQTAAEQAVVEVLVRSQPASEPGAPCRHCGQAGEGLILEYGIAPVVTRLHPACHPAHMNARMVWAAELVRDACLPAEPAEGTGPTLPVEP